MTTLGTWKKGDEKFTLAGVDYWYLLPESGGPLGFSSSTPFAPKSTTGDRQYADYDPWSYISLSDFSGGMGQERLTDITRYYRAYNADARGGDIVLGPLVTEVGLHGLSPEDELYLTGETALFPSKLTTAGTKLARRILTPADCTALRFVWVPVAVAQSATLTVKLYTDVAGLPGAEVATTSEVKYNSPANYMTWLMVDFVTAATVTASTYYWVSIEGATSALFWASEYDADFSGFCAQYSGSWAAVDDYRPIIAFNEANQVSVFDYPPIWRYGYGEDSVERMWACAGHNLYYIDKDSTPQVVLAPTTVKQLTNYIADAVWWRGSGDSHPYLYVALWDSDEMVKFDGNIGTEEWADIPGSLQARKLCVHDSMLWRCDDRYQVSGSLDGTTYGTAVNVGGNTRPVRGMVSWDGYLWVGKEDGLYRVEYPVGYPTTGTPTATLVVDLSAMSFGPNLSCMVVHQSDLYFNVLNGFLKYTANGVLTSVTPESGPDMPVSDRTVFRAAASTVNALYVCAEGVAGAPSSLLVYQDGAWHPIVTSPRLGDLMRSVAIDPGSYGSFPRVWFDMGLAGAYVQMPLTTQRRWTWDADDEARMDYAAEGWLELSRMDGNLITVNKHWQSITLDVRGLYDTDPAPVRVYYRTEEGGGWTELVVDTGLMMDGLNTYTMTGVANEWIEFRLELERTLWPDPTGYEKSPRIRALVVKYMERPQDLKAFTRTYMWGSDQAWRTGAAVDLSLAEWYAQLETLRESALPLTFEHVCGASYTAHIVDYNATELFERRHDGKDYLSVLCTVRLQVVE